jgi:predicted AAA+ superfamily ATPase
MLIANSQNCIPNICHVFHENRTYDIRISRFNCDLIPKPELTQRVRTALKRSRVVALIGPRQAGKTTLARTFVPMDTLNYFDLEDPVSLVRLEQPLTALKDLD